jgi:hypothetical protein
MIRTTKTKKSTSSKKAVATTKTTFVKVSKGVYRIGANTYAVRKMVNGVRNYASFSSVTKAKAYYKSFSK